jgi:hypothetical protein
VQNQERLYASKRLQYQSRIHRKIGKTLRRARQPRAAKWFLSPFVFSFCELGDEVSGQIAFHLFILLLCDFATGVSPIKNLPWRFMEVLPGRSRPRSRKTAPPEHAHHAQHEKKKQKGEDPHPSHTRPWRAPSPHSTLRLSVSENLPLSDSSKIHTINCSSKISHNYS